MRRFSEILLLAMCALLPPLFVTGNDLHDAQLRDIAIRNSLVTRPTCPVKQHLCQHPGGYSCCQDGWTCCSGLSILFNFNFPLPLTFCRCWLLRSSVSTFLAYQVSDQWSEVYLAIGLSVLGIPLT
jgi:hypothetical protein